MSKRLIIFLAYYLKTSPRYQSAKMFFYNLLENSHSRMKSFFDIFMILLVMFSVYLLIYDVKTELNVYALRFEHIVVTIFIIEYILRLWLYGNIHDMVIQQYEKNKYLNIPFQLHRVFIVVIRKKLEYVFSPIALVDLLAIFPSYRSIRILRIFLIFRLFKLFRYSQSIKVFAEVLSTKKFELYTLALFLSFLVFIASTAIYLFENEPSGGQISHLFDAVYWSIVTLSTVGYGDITPQSTGGRAVTLALIVSGLGVLSFFTSIIVAAFAEKMHELRENRTDAELEKINDFIIVCGFGRVGQETVRLFKKDNQPFIIIDTNSENVLIAKNKGYLVIHDDACNNNVLVRAGINSGASAVLCTTENDVVNVYITLTSRQLNPDIQIISRANRHENIKKLIQAGANHTIQPFEILGMVAAEYVGQPVASEALVGIRLGEKQVLLETIAVEPDSPIEKMKISDINFPAMKISLVGVISSNPVHKKHQNRYKVRKHNFYFNPAPHFILHMNDILVLLGRDLSIDHFKFLLEKRRLRKQTS